MGPAPELWPPGARGAPRRTAQRAQSCCCTTSSMTEDRTVKRVCWELSPRLPALQRERLSFPCSYFSHVVLARLARPLRPLERVSEAACMAGHSRFYSHACRPEVAGGVRRPGSSTPARRDCKCHSQHEVDR